MGCICLFLNESKDCISHFMKYDTLTKTTQEKQEKFQLPWIFIEASSIPENAFSKIGLTFEGYRKDGKWKGNQSEYDEETTFDKVSESLGDLIQSGGFETAVDEYSDQYE